MYRTENNYHWKTLIHWKMALEDEAVRKKIIENTKNTDILLENAIKLLINNCFPLALICYRSKEKQKEIWMTSLWIEIFDFLEGKRCIRKEGEEIYFKDMEDYEQQAILNAWIVSVWLAEE